MATNGSKGVVELFEDFIGWDIIADKPEFAVDTDPAIEVEATTPNGVLRATMDAGQANIGGVLFGQTQWDITNGVYVEARLKLSAIGAADERVGVWLTDLQEDTLSEYPFTATSTALTAATNPDDAVGIFWEGNGPNSGWFAAGQNTDAVTANGVTGQTEWPKPVAATYDVVSFDIAPGGLRAEFAVNGKIIYTYTSATTPVCADVPLIAVWGVTEGTTAINCDLDYILVRSSRQ